jgi:hypothetical protein
MAGIITAALHDIVVERVMPKGYTWAKVVKCWTCDPKSARFFPPRTTDYGEELPAAYFTAVMAYDQDQGWHERDIKFVGDEAESAVLALKEDGQIALISCQGHMSTSTIELEDGRSVVKTTILVKVGSTIIHEMEKQGERNEENTLEAYANAKMREVEPNASAAVPSSVREADFEESVWPTQTDFEATANMDDAPF